MLRNHGRHCKARKNSERVNLVHTRKANMELARQRALGAVNWKLLAFCLKALNYSPIGRRVMCLPCRCVSV